MSDAEQAAPTFTYFLGVDPVPGEQKVHALFGDDDQRGYKFGLDAKILAPLITELTARLRALRSPQADDFLTAALRAKSARLAVWEEGPALVLNMGDEYAVAVALDRSSLATLHAEIGTFLNQQ